jgi:hypothetical protein
MPTDFPKSGDDKQISLRNSEYPQFDYDYALNLREEYPDIWSRGGNIRGNSAFTNWGKARSGDITDAVADWIKEREAWAARHYRNNRLAGVVAQVKWGVIGTLGEGGMKELINESKENDRNRDEKGVLRGIFDYLKGYFQEVDRRIKDVDSWDGSASRWPDTESYCNDCLINLNEEAGNESPDSWAQEYCKLPVREPGDEEGTFVRQAVYAAAGGRGITQVERPEDIPESVWNGAVSEAATMLLRAYDEMDEDAPESIQQIARGIMMSDLHEEAIRAAMEKYPGAYINDFYMDNGDMYIILAQEGKLYRTPVMVDSGMVSLGEWEVVEVSFEPQTRTTVQRTDDGKYRWLSISASSVLNRVGEIDSRQLFDSFVDHIERTGEYPVRQFYHMGDASDEFVIGQCDFVARDKNLLITSGYYHDTDLARRSAEAHIKNPEYWGESIGYKSLGYPELVDVNDAGIKIPVYKEGVLEEISMLPEKRAANLFTQTRMEVVRMVNEEARRALLKLYDGDEEVVSRLLADAEMHNRAIEEDGLITRSSDDEVEEGDFQPEIVIEDRVMDDLVERATKKMSTQQADLVQRINEVAGRINEAVDEINAALQDVNDRLSDLEREEGEKQREWVEDLPERRRVVVTRPRVARANDVDEEEVGPHASTAQSVLNAKIGKVS